MQGPDTAERGEGVEDEEGEEESAQGDGEAGHRHLRTNSIKVFRLWCFTFMLKGVNNKKNTYLPFKKKCIKNCVLLPCCHLF